jgi:signal transduction histidine kinase
MMRALSEPPLHRPNAWIHQNREAWRRSCELNEAVTEVEHHASRVINEDIEIVMRLERDLEPVQADQSDIELAILNLVLNARDASLEEEHSRLKLHRYTWRVSLWHPTWDSPWAGTRS